jgi:hypothetical protein
MLWTMVLPGIVLWLIETRSWDSLRLVFPQGWRLWGTIALLLILIAAFARTIARLARNRRRKRIKLGNPSVEKYSPHTRYELGWWVMLSLSAGFCEEWIFRGYLIWAFQSTLGLWGAAALSVVVFAFAHAYQGAKGVLATGIAGAVLTLVVLVSGSLIPAMLLHALVDIEQGLVAWLVFRDSRDATETLGYEDSARS